MTLWLDVRCGGAGVKLGGRELNAAEVVMAEYKNIKAFDAMHTFYRTLCSDVLLPSKPVYGFNNWYYAYGNSSHSDIIRDTRWLSDLCRGINNRPFMVTDDGWQPNKTDWPWDRGNERFPDMKALADEIKALDVHPGLWVRYLANRQQKMPGVPEEAKMMRDHEFLDPSHPFVRDHVIDVTRRIVDWGYELIFSATFPRSTCSAYGDCTVRTCWPRTAGTSTDQSRTSAEIIVDFYRVIREAAGEDTLILGCDVIGFLAAGLVHLNRTGYDTSGREWEGTRSAGVNTLAFHMAAGGHAVRCGRGLRAVYQQGAAEDGAQVAGHTGKERHGDCSYRPSRARWIPKGRMHCARPWRAAASSATCSSRWTGWKIPARACTTSTAPA